MNSFSYLLSLMLLNKFETSDELRAAITKHTEMKTSLFVAHPFPDYAQMHCNTYRCPDVPWSRLPPCFWT